MWGTTAATWHEELRRVEATIYAIRHFTAPSPRRDAWLAETLRAWALMKAHMAGIGTGKPEWWAGSVE